MNTFLLFHRPSLGGDFAELSRGNDRKTKEEEEKKLKLTFGTDIQNSLRCYCEYIASNENDGSPRANNHLYSFYSFCRIRSNKRRPSQLPYSFAQNNRCSMFQFKMTAFIGG